MLTHQKITQVDLQKEHRKVTSTISKWFQKVLTIKIANMSQVTDFWQYINKSAIDCTCVERTEEFLVGVGLRRISGEPGCTSLGAQ